MAGRRAGRDRPVTLVQTPDVIDPAMQRAFDTLTSAVKELQMRRLLDLFTSTEAGYVPASGGDPDDVLHADGTWGPAAGGGGSGAVDDVTGTTPITVTPTTGSVVVSLDNNGVTDVKLRDSAGVSVIGRSANTVGDPADIVAGADGDILRRAGGVLGFGTIPASSVTGLLTGSGTLNTIAKWTPSGTQLGDSSVTDDGTTVYTPAQIWGKWSANTDGGIAIAGGTGITDTTPANNGFDFGMGSGNVVWRSKLATGGTIAAYVGAGASPGNTNQWLSVDGLANATFFGNVTLGDATTDAHSVNGIFSITTPAGTIPALRMGKESASTVWGVGHDYDSTNFSFNYFNGATWAEDLVSITPAGNLIVHVGSLVFDANGTATVYNDGNMHVTGEGSTGGMLILSGTTIDFRHTANGATVGQFVGDNLGVGAAAAAAQRALFSTSGSHNTMRVDYVGVAQAADRIALDVHNIAAYSGAGNTTVGVKSTVVASGPADAAGMINIAYYADATIAVGTSGTAYSFYGAAGLLYNVGNLQIDGKATLGNAIGDAHALTGTLNLNGTAGTAGQVAWINGASGPQWAALSTVGIVAGSGTLNTVAKWTPSGTQLGNSSITDDGTTVISGVNTTVQRNDAGSHANRPVLSITNSASSGSFDHRADLSFNVADSGNVTRNHVIEAEGQTLIITPYAALTINSSTLVNVPALGNLAVKKGASGAPAWTTPALEIENNSDCAINLRGPTANDKAIYFSNPTALADGGIVYDNPGNARGLQLRTGGNTTRLTIDSSGNATFTANVTVGATLDVNGDLSKFGATSGDGATYINNDTLNFAYSTNATAGGVINHYSFNAGVTQFRNLTIRDGKGADVASFTGSSKLTDLVGSVHVQGVPGTYRFLFFDTTGAKYTTMYNSAGKLRFGGATAVGGAASIESFEIDPDTASATALGNFAVNGNATIGDASTDTHTLNGNLTFSNTPTAGPVKLGAVQARIYLGRQIITASGTYTPTVGTRAVWARFVGGGAGGGGVTGVAANCAAGAGGGAGEYVETYIDPGALITSPALGVTIGTAGAGGTAAGGAGGNGGTTSISINGTTYSAGGGTGGAGSTAGTTALAIAGGAGGTGGAGAADIRTNGMTGGPSLRVSASIAMGANGGSSPFGAGGKHVLNGAAGTLAGSGKGAGGGGAHNATGAATAGGAGTAGVIIIEEYA